MDQQTNSTTTDSIAKAGITQAEAENTPGATAPAESSTGAAQPKAAPENAFAAEDAELERLQAQVLAESKAGGKTSEAGTTATDGTGTTAGEGTAAAATGETTATGAAKPATVEDATAAAAAAGHNASTAAIVALRKANSELKGENLLLHGENRVLKTLVDADKFAGETTGGETTQVEPTPEEQELQALAAERVRLAEEVDGGRMTMRDYAEQTNSISARERELAAIQTQQIIEASSQPVNDLGLQEHVTTLIQTYPILQKLTAAQLKPFEQIAYEQAEAEGKPIQPGPIGTKDLRERMGVLATKVYGVPVAATPAAAAATGASATTGSTTVRTQPNAAEREAKLTQAGAHPPDIGSTGSGNISGGPSDAEALAILIGRDEDAAMRWLAANPGFVQKQIGNSARTR